MRQLSSAGQTGAEHSQDTSRALPIASGGSSRKCTGPHTSRGAALELTVLGNRSPKLAPSERRVFVRARCPVAKRFLSHAHATAQFWPQGVRCAFCYVQAAHRDGYKTRRRFHERIHSQAAQPRRRKRWPVRQVIVAVHPLATELQTRKRFFQNRWESEPR